MTPRTGGWSRPFLTGQPDSGARAASPSAPTPALAARPVGRAGAVRPGRPGRLVPGQRRLDRDGEADLRRLPGLARVPGLRAVRRGHLGRDRHWHLGRHHAPRTRRLRRERTAAAA